MRLTERILRLGLINFRPKAECGEAGRQSVAAEGRWVGPKSSDAVLPFWWQMPLNIDFVLVLYYLTITWYM